MCHTDCSLRIKLHHHVGSFVHLSEKLVVSVGSQVSHLSILGPQWDGTPQAGADTILHCPEQTHLSSPLSNPIVGPRDLYDFSTGTTTYVNCPLLLCQTAQKVILIRSELRNIQVTKWHYHDLRYFQQESVSPAVCGWNSWTIYDQDPWLLSWHCNVQQLQGDLPCNKQILTSGS